MDQAPVVAEASRSGSLTRLVVSIQAKGPEALAMEQVEVGVEWVGEVEALVQAVVCLSKVRSREFY